MHITYTYKIYIQQNIVVLSLCNPMDCDTPGLPLPHYLPELAQLHVH